MTPWVYLTCPACSRRIDEPLSRYSGPVAYLHTRGGPSRGGRSCRLLITPDPQGHAHRIEQVKGMSLEAALEQALAAWHTRKAA